MSPVGCSNPAGRGGLECRKHLFGQGFGCGVLQGLWPHTLWDKPGWKPWTKPQDKEHT